ncbi:hypothetical protein Tco_0276917 [Tanacetum coccineum]
MKAHMSIIGCIEELSSAPKRSTGIRFRIPQRRSTRLTPPAPVTTVDNADEMILQDTLQVSLAEHKSQEEQEARENVELVNEHLASVEIEKMVEGTENVIDDSSIPRNDDQNILGTRLEPRSDKESLEVEITNDKEVEITNVVIPVNVNKEEKEITDEGNLCKTFLMSNDHIPHNGNETSIVLLAEEKFLKIKQVVKEEQTQPEFLQERSRRRRIFAGMLAEGDFKMLIKF